MEWQEITLIVLVVILMLAGGYIKRLTKEIKDLVDAFSEAIADKKITKEELDKILKEADDIRKVILEIAKLVARK